MRTDLLTEKELNEYSRMNLQQGYYQIKSVNETILDRTYEQDIKIDGKNFNCIAHYIQYMKCVTWGLPQNICDYVLHKYKADYPMKADKEYIAFEDNFNMQYNDEIHGIPEQYRTKWRDLCPIVTAEAITSLHEQSTAFKSALKETRKSLLIEISPSILWGIDTEKFSNDFMSNPTNWRGENLYCQVLMAVRDKHEPSLSNIVAKFKDFINKKA